MSKIFVILQIFLLVGVVSFVYFFAPSLDYPGNNEILEKNNIDFKFRNANVILIDSSPDFRNPQEIDMSKTNMSEFILRPGTYYWKAVGVVESNTRKFTIDSKVGLELNDSKLKNVGNVPLNVSEKTDSGINGLAILDVQVEYPVKEENKTVYKGEQYEK